jgi:ribosome-binding ATPase YchF (GTP1/OBG family)
MERGFIKAEVINFKEFRELGSYSVAREKGLLQIVGRDYIVQDGDIIYIHFTPTPMHRCEGVPKKNIIK